MSGTLFGVPEVSLRASVPEQAQESQQTDHREEFSTVGTVNHWKPINRLNTRERMVAKEQAPRGKQLPVWAGTAM